MTQEEEKQIRNILEYNDPYIYLGAGFSYGAKRGDDDIPLGNKVRDIILAEIKKINPEVYEEEKNDPLQYVCNALKQLNPTVYIETLTHLFQGFSPADFHQYISEYDWHSIFTVNIDDIVERVYGGQQKKLDVFYKAEPEKRRTKRNQNLYKLHGTVKDKDYGYVFATSEYDALLANHTTDFRIGALVQAFNSNSIFIVGTEFDEPEIRFFDAIFRNECIKFEAVFINPKPTQKLLGLIKRHKNFSIIKISAEEFLQYLHNHKDDINNVYYKLNNNLKRYGLFNTELIKQNFTSNNGTYKTELYFGDAPTWQDILDCYPVQYSGITKLQNEIMVNTSCRIFIVTGALYSGKTTILRQVFYNLSQNKDFYCLFAVNEEFDYWNIEKTINELPTGIKKILLFFDEVGEYYSSFKKVLELDERIVLVVSSYEKIHTRKRYELPPCKVYECKVPDRLSDDDISNIKRKLDEKGLSGNLFNKDINQWKKVVDKKENIVSAMYAVTNSHKFQNHFENILKKENAQEQSYFKLLVIGAMLYNLGKPKIKQEILIRSGIKIRPELLTLLKDYIKETDDNSIRIKNKFIANAILHLCEDKKFIETCIIDVCNSIVCFINENDRNYYKDVYEYLTKYKYLKRVFLLEDSSIEKIYASLQEHYRQFSYYWLQLGILEQNMGDFEYALQHFKTALEMNPKSYAIQHAIARNYCKSAMSEENIAVARSTFDEGRKKLLDIVETREFLQSKAYSVHSLVLETINFYNEIQEPIPDNENKKCANLLNEVTKQFPDDYMMKDLQQKYFAFLCERNIQFGKLYSDYEENLDE